MRKAPTHRGAHRPLWGITAIDRIAGRLTWTIRAPYTSIMRTAAGLLPRGKMIVDLWNELLDWTDPTTKDLEVELAIGEYMATSDRENLARKTLRSILGRLREIPSIEYLVRLARLARKVDPQLAPRLVERLLAREDLPEEIRREWSPRLLTSPTPPSSEGPWFDPEGS